MGGIVIDIWEKLNFSGSFWITKRCQKYDFCSGGALKAPPYGRVKNSYFILAISTSYLHKFVCSQSINPNNSGIKFATQKKIISTTTTQLLGFCLG